MIPPPLASSATPKQTHMLFSSKDYGSGAAWQAQASPRCGGVSKRWGDD